MENTKSSYNLRSLFELLNPITNQLEAEIAERKARLAEYRQPDQSIFEQLEWHIEPRREYLLHGLNDITFYIVSEAGEHNLEIEGTLTKCHYTYDPEIGGHRLVDYDTETTAYLDGAIVELSDNLFDRVCNMVAWSVNNY